MLNIARGNIHIHSNLSDGTSSIKEIAREAGKAGLDFIIITDHEHLKGKKMGLEGFYDDTLVLIGQEVNRRKNHYLVFDLNEEIENNEENPKEVVEKVKNKGGFGFIAHPYEQGSPLVHDNMTYPWTDFEIEGFTGMEIANYSSAWRDGAQTPLQAVYANFINDLAFMEFPNFKSYYKWKELTRKKRVAGIFGSDAHAPIYRSGPFSFKVLSYKYLFNSGNNYVFLKKQLINKDGNKELKKARENLFSALKKGHLYISLDRIEKGDGLKVYLKDNNGEVYLPGDLVAPGKYKLFVGFQEDKKNKGKKLKIENLENSDIKIFELPLKTEFELNYGTYHMSISHSRSKNWIILNPFYVWG